LRYKLFKLIENIALGLFVNGSYGIMIGNINLANIIIIVGSIYTMGITIFYGEEK